MLLTRCLLPVVAALCVLRAASASGSPAVPAAALSLRGSMQAAVTVTVIVRAEGRPVADALVTAGAETARTDEVGRAVLRVPAGAVTVTVTHDGFVDARQSLVVTSTANERGTEANVELHVELNVDPQVDVNALPTVEEEITVVATTRTGRRVEDQPTRVEVLGREEIEEKMLMTPGDIVMMLNEMGGLRVQATSPSLGAASIRVQGMKGRYTRILSDGLPLFGQQVGGLGLLQIPPMDLGQVEVIKGVASALYGAGAMGGVVNLLTRRPGDEPSADLLINQSTLGATDGVAFVSRPLTPAWRMTLLAGAHRQSRNDRDGDGWADLAGYQRAIVRPRLFWQGQAGNSAFLTAGVTLENRDGGTMPGASLATTGLPFVEALDTRRYDVAGTTQTIVAGRFLVTARGAAASQHHTHKFGELRERDRHTNLFGELAVRGTAGRHTWVLGTAYERDVYRPLDVPRFAYTFDVPGIFAQDDVDVTPWLSLSTGARIDHHSRYGTFVSPRVAALARHGAWTSRLSVGRGFFATTPLTEETEAAGLSRLQVPSPLRAERGTSVSLDLTRRMGVLSVTATAFASRVTDPLAIVRDTRYALINRSDATINTGSELLATFRRGRWGATGTYAFVRAREGAEGSDGGRLDVPLTPRHSAGLVGMWEEEGWGRVGLELYLTGRQRLEVNPDRTTSAPYAIIGALVEKRFGRLRVFVNAENLTDVRQTKWNSLLRPSQGVDGRWTVDAWAPLDGRAINGGIRLGL